MENINKIKNEINSIKEEIIISLNQKDLNTSKTKMEKYLKEEDYLTVYDILNRILNNLKEKCNIIVSNKECPNELRVSLDSVIYSSNKLDIKELKEFKEKINELYGSNYINKAENNENKLVNEVIFEKLKMNNNYTEQLIKTRLKILCIEKHIDYQWLGIPNPSFISINDSLNLRRSNGSISFLNIRNSSISNSGIQPPIIDNNNNNLSRISFADSNLFICPQTSLIASNRPIDTNDDDPFNRVETIESGDDEVEDPFKRVKTIESKEIKLPEKEQKTVIKSEEDKLNIMKQGENLFFPYDENIDKKCYEINNIQNWAESFYNLKTGIILEKYKELMSKSEYHKFFEGLNYEYGINNYPLDTKKAFEIYKEAADKSTDTLSMYRLYHIYKKDFKKFNIKERCHVLEKFYIMKCFTYLTPDEKSNELVQRFDIKTEIFNLFIDSKNTFYNWYLKLFEFLQDNYDIYNINQDDTILVEAIIYFYFEQKTENTTKYMTNKLINLANKDNPEAMYNLAGYYKDENYYKTYYKKLYDMNYYRSFADYSKELPDEKETLDILKKSISNGYYSHIKDYFIIFMKMNEFENIFKSESLKSEFLYILKGLINNIIVDDIKSLFEYNYTRKATIKHFNLGDEFKKHLDPIFKEILNYLNNFVKGTDEENKKKVKSYFISKGYFSLIYSLYGLLYYYGVDGLIEKNYNETLIKYNYLIKIDELTYIDRFYLYFIYYAKKKQRKIKKNLNENEEKELKELEKKTLDSFYQDLLPEEIKKYPSGFFYYLSRLFKHDSINNKDLILEYVFLNRASNAEISRLEGKNNQTFEQFYLKYKAKKKIKYLTQEENYKKIKNAKGAINIEGYGEDGSICPICLENKKSIIALPCKHFFCNICMDKLLDKGNCPVCRTDIKITFDINLKKEKLIKSILVQPFVSYDLDNSFGGNPIDPFDLASL